MQMTFKQQISEEEYLNTKLKYEKECMIICPNRIYMEERPYHLIDGEFFIGEDAYWEFRNNIEKYYGSIYYFRNDILEEDFQVKIINKEFIPQ